ncbi:MAG: CPXCG motif-containing cysteine-rich protein [Gammaproteobacteria bacterium]
MNTPSELIPYSLSCPYCGEVFDILLDCSAGNQAYIEDCQVCCRPIECQLMTDSEGKCSSLVTLRDDD